MRQIQGFEAARVRVVPGMPVSPSHPGPYGLHHLADFGISPTFPDMTLPSGKAGRVVRALNYKLTDFPVAEVIWDRWQGRHCHEPIVTWDERHGIWSRLGETRPVATGVIWVTEPNDRHRPLAMRVLRHMALVWPTSTGQLPELRNTFRVPPGRLRYIRFGVDADAFPARSYRPTALIASAGNDRNRDYSTLIRAVAIAKARVSSATLALLCRHRVDIPSGIGRRYGSSDSVSAQDLYEDAALVAVATKPNLHVSGLTVSLEAMASARPVVATQTPGWEDYIEDGVTGLFSPPGDAESFAANLVRLLSDPEEAAAMGRAGRRRLEELELTEVGLSKRLAEALLAM